MLIGVVGSKFDVWLISETKLHSLRVYHKDLIEQSMVEI